MTALAAQKTLDMYGAPICARKYLMKASTTIYSGGLVMENAAGTTEPGACGTTSRRVVGVSAENKISGASAPSWIQVYEGFFWLTGTSLGQDDVGNPAFVVDDATIEETPPVNTIPAGLIVEYSSATKVLVLVTAENMAGRAIVGRHSLGTRSLAAIADGDISIGWIPGFWGRILGIEAEAVVVASTADKATTLTAEIDTTDVTGGTVTLTTAGLDTIGDRMVSAAIPTAGNVFTPSSVIDVEASATAAFSEGEAEIALKYEQFLF